MKNVHDQVSSEKECIFLQFFKKTARFAPRE